MDFFFFNINSVQSKIIKGTDNAPNSSTVHVLTLKCSASELKSTINEANRFETKPGTPLFLLNCRLALVVQSANFNFFFLFYFFKAWTEKKWASFHYNTKMYEAAKEPISLKFPLGVGGVFFPLSQGSVFCQLSIKMFCFVVYRLHLYRDRAAQEFSPLVCTETLPHAGGTC